MNIDGGLWNALLHGLMGFGSFIVRILLGLLLVDATKTFARWKKEGQVHCIVCLIVVFIISTLTWLVHVPPEQMAHIWYLTLLKFSCCHFNQISISISLSTLKLTGWKHKRAAIVYRDFRNTKHSCITTCIVQNRHWNFHCKNLLSKNLQLSE